MFRIKAIQIPTLIEAVLMVIVMISLMSASIIFYQAPPHIALLLAMLSLIIYGLIKKISYQQLESGMVEGAKAGISAVFLFFMIGILIAAWMLAGTIPTLIYGGFELVTPKFYLAVIFVVTAIIGLSVGSSLTTVGTVGLAFIGISQTLDVSLSMTAGAIVSGAFFGDKMSPLSDTTNMASSILQVDLFDHIKNMGWTTFPAFLISLVLFAIISPNITVTEFTKMNEFQQSLAETGLINWYAAVIPIAVLLLLSIKKVPAFLALSAGSLTALIISIFTNPQPIGKILEILFGGYVSETGNEQIDTLLTRGGMESMLFTIGIVILALSLGGLLFSLGIVPKLLNSIENLLNSIQSVIISSALTAIGINVLIGEQYLSILLTGEAYGLQYKKVGLETINLARVSEDAGTVVNPLVPWSVCGVFIASVLDVSTLSYLPFTFFCLLSPLLTIAFGVSGKTLTYVQK